MPAAVSVLREGEMLGPFRLERKIAIGGMAEVWSAQRLSDDQPKKYAIKVLFENLARDPALRAMFTDEVRIAKRLRHPNIVHVEGEYEDRGYVFQAMDLIDGKDLRRLLADTVKARSTLPIAIAVTIVREVARGLTYAHAARGESGEPLEIVHRDVSPHNVMIDRRGAVRVVDFGVAKARERITRTKIGVIKGKISYMSPEQMLAGPVSAQSDIFSLGIVLWEAIALRRLFGMASDAEVVSAVTDARIPPIRDVNPETPQPLADLIGQMLQQHPKNRPDSMRTIENELTKILATRYEEDASAPETLAAWIAPHLDQPRRKTAVMPGREVAPAVMSPPLPPLPVAPPLPKSPASATPVGRPEVDAAARTEAIALSPEIAAELQDLRQSTIEQPAGDAPWSRSEAPSDPPDDGLGKTRPYSLEKKAELAETQGLPPQSARAAYHGDTYRDAGQPEWPVSRTEPDGADVQETPRAVELMRSEETKLPRGIDDSVETDNPRAPADFAPTELHRPSPEELERGRSAERAREEVLRGPWPEMKRSRSDLMEQSRAELVRSRSPVERGRAELERGRGRGELPVSRSAEAERARAEEERARVEEERARAEQERSRGRRDLPASRSAEAERARAEEERARAEQERSRGRRDLPASRSAEAERAREEQERAARAEQERSRGRRDLPASRSAEAERAREEQERAARAEQERSRGRRDLPASRSAEAERQRAEDERARAEQERSRGRRELPASRSAEAARMREEQERALRAEQERSRGRRDLPASRSAEAERQRAEEARTLLDQDRSRLDQDRSRGRRDLPASRSAEDRARAEQERARDALRGELPRSRDAEMRRDREDRQGDDSFAGGFERDSDFAIDSYLDRADDLAETYSDPGPPAPRDPEPVVRLHELRPPKGGFRSERPIVQAQEPKSARFAWVVGGLVAVIVALVLLGRACGL